MSAADSSRVLALLAERLVHGPGTTYLVGGALRDLLLSRHARDIDLLVEGRAEAESFALAALEDLSGMHPVLFERRPPHTHRVVIEGVIVDTSFCPPDGVAVELRRRDFTVNAMAAPLGPLGAITGPPRPESTPANGGITERIRPLLVDPTGGLEDLAGRRLREASPRSLAEDPLRLLRALRLLVTLAGFSLDDSLVGTIRSLARRVTDAAAERIGAELALILESPRSGTALRLMEDLGLLDPILPELAPLRGLAQPAAHHDHDARRHTLLSVQHGDRLAAGENPFGIPPLEDEEACTLKWALLLHDTGKAAAATRDASGTPRFHGHEEISATLAGEALRRLRVPARVASPAVSLIRWHLRPGALSRVSAGERPLRRLARLAGPHLPLLVLHALADRRASGGADSGAREAALTEVCRRALGVLEEVSDTAQAPPLLDGSDIMEVLGLPPGPRVGAILRWLDRLRTEKRIHTREEALAILRSLPPPRIRD